MWSWKLRNRSAETGTATPRIWRAKLPSSSVRSPDRGWIRTTGCLVSKVVALKIWAYRRCASVGARVRAAA